VVSRVHGFELGVHGTGTGYTVLRVRVQGAVRSSSLPQHSTNLAINHHPSADVANNKLQTTSLTAVAPSTSTHPVLDTDSATQQLGGLPVI